jgi:hypothetical protein
MSDNKRKYQDEAEYQKRLDEAEKLLALTMPVPLLSVEQKLRNAQHILRQLVETYKITEYASFVPLNLRCDGCHQPFFEDEDEDHPYDTFDILSMCSNCIQIAKKLKSTL